MLNSFSQRDSQGISNVRSSPKADLTAPRSGHFAPKTDAVNITVSKVRFAKSGWGGLTGD